MTEETQALVLQLREWVDGQSVTYASVLMQDAAAALTALARDLETADRRIAGLTQASDGLLEQLGVALSDLAAARQERDAALEMARRVGESGDHHIQMALDGRTREREAVDAAVRAARAETWEAAERFIVKLLDKLHHWGDGDATDDAVITKFEAEFRALRASREGQ